MKLPPHAPDRIAVEFEGGMYSDRTVREIGTADCVEYVRADLVEAPVLVADPEVIDKAKLKPGNILIFPGHTSLTIDAERVLDGAKEEIGDMVVVLGRDKEGELYFAANNPDQAHILLLLIKAQEKLLKVTKGTIS